ncbi:hypothetical protein AVEN_60938-1 [Araneus ventricosus]|uniref:Uncharacterized protein n=1 Tax=Araneus ventricosus TaxID=182803 RepID=A0A4Y2NBJ0_ARAVE|nr:hypothetical protein AVEN_24316-1 [Araneus ventricosus]GBN36760.1 hypothetical protein AVEN_60938-1 [Araneus ventricosus]
MGLDFVPASIGGMEPEIAHKTLESQSYISLFTANDVFFIIEVLWLQIVISVNPTDNEIVSLAKIMGLEMDSNYIDELVEEHRQELIPEELMELP